ncbi:MAG: hypothetical protein AMS27_11090 [Bacteroides sp. SM23_62_1]|nr:MAG: hypothetical protein AMS27_11090 [Bacteroides sp. SM23_62_1]
MKNRSTVLIFLIVMICFDTQAVISNDRATDYSSDLITCQDEDTLRIISISGKVIDAKTGDPVVFASIFIDGTRIGTVTNTDGDFIIKVPHLLSGRQIGITHIGYITSIHNIGSLKPSGNVIELLSAPYEIEEVTIRQLDPVILIRSALAKIPENYSEEPVMMTSFYRETIIQNRNYVAIAEAVLDAYKASYKNTTDIDRVRVFKGRKSQDVKKMDTVLFKFQGGPYTSYMLDVAKNPSELIAEDDFKYYEYKMGGIVRVNDAQAYVIDFDQKEEVDFPLYKGKLYLGVENLAIVGIDFEISPKRIERASEYLIRKKPAGMSINVEKGNYLVNYRIIDGLWYLNYVRTELVFRVKWKKHLFRSMYTTTSEMAVTDISSENIQKYKYRETTKLSDVFVEEVTDFEDPDFWGDYNIIKPDESIEAAIERLSRKLKRRTE